MLTLEHTPLDPDALSPRARKATSPETPLKLRALAARGALPLTPAETLTVLYQLSLDADASLREAASSTLSQLDEALLPGLVSDDTLDPRVLDALTRARLTGDDALLERLVTNRAVADETIAAVAAVAGERVVEIIAGIHVRLLRTPEIIEALFENPAARQATLDRILDLARREGVTLRSLEAMQRALEQVDDDGPGLDEETYRALLAESLARAVEEAGEDDRLERHRPDDDDEEEAPEDEKKVGLWKKIQMMNASQKIRLASVGSREARSLLIRDSKRLVYMATINSPKVSMSEVQTFAKNRSIPEDVIHFIARRRDWVRYYPVVVSLVNNPKCPPGEGIAFLKQLRTNDLRALMRNKNIPSLLVRQAREFYRRKSSGKR